MRIGIPHYGNAYIPVKTIARRLASGGTEVMIPPPMTQRTLDFGVKYSPEEACLPYKLTLGSLLETCELGADTLIQGRGTGICRLGYYARGQEQMLRDLGYDARFLTVDISHNKFGSIMRLLKDLTNDAPVHEIISALFLA